MKTFSLVRYFFSNYKGVNLSFNHEIKAAHLKLSNPKKRNVLSHETIKELHSCLDEVEKSA